MESIDYFTKEQSFLNKNILITGATGGIGRQVTESLLKCGAKVIIMSRSDKKTADVFSKND
jgi:short-subunit dehydrogenase